ncbi:MAG: TetR family transcriptional regulator [Rhodospirillales bacterium 70-18]|nr:TetR/AcrR family transcriptional regulator [Rhodospirillales bacterium]OJY68324.1 MAG: TetR family transcriptional regulator [Rhodospirillales bacterium 70-18]
MSSNVKEAILSAARKAAQAHGYGGLNFRELAAEVGIKAASIHYHFPSKADLGAAVARRYWEDIAAELEAMQAELPDATACLQHYPAIFRRSLENGNRICLCSFMAAEYDDLPEPVKVEVQAFADVNVTWLAKALSTAEGGDASTGSARALAIFAAVSGAQLLARSRADVGLFDSLIGSYRDTGLLPG